MTGEVHLFVGSAALADLLGGRLGGEARLFALHAQLLDRDVARRPRLRARDDPRRPVLVPDPHVLHLEVEERVGRLRDLGQLELVAEVRRVLCEDAVTEQPEDGGVLLLEAKLELRLELVELVEVAHAHESSFARRASTGPFPGTSRAGSSSARGSRTKRRSCSLGCGTSSAGSSIRASP